MKNDRRNIYTETIIKNTMLELLEKKALNKITVTEICEKADINRATFYNHYVDIYYLFEEMQNDFCKSFLETSAPERGFHSSDEIKSNVQKNVDLIIKHKKEFMTFYLTDKCKFLSEKMIEREFKWMMSIENINDYFDDPDIAFNSPDELYLTLTFLFCGLFEIMFQFLSGAKEISSDTVVSLFTRIMYNKTVIV